jgi:ribosome-associated toxin RatA of RatAB toxin-antitoxin module
MNSRVSKFQFEQSISLHSTIFVPIELGTPGFTSYSEKFTKVDHEKRLKEVEVIEGGYLDLGFTLYRFRFEIIEKGNDSCIIKSTIEFDVKEEAAANVSYATIEPLAKVAELVKTHLIKNKATKDAN